MSKALNPFTTEWRELNPLASVIKSDTIIAAGVEGCCIEVKGTEYRYVKAEPLCDIERNKLDLFNKNNKMESKYTKGEWYVSDIPQEDGEYIYTKHNPFQAIARVYKGENAHAPQAEANARLIASAPSLLEALEEILYKDSDGNYRIGQHGDTLVSDKIQNAIKKVKGE